MSLANPGLEEHKALRSTVKQHGWRASTDRSLQAAPTASLLSHLTAAASLQLRHLCLLPALLSPSTLHAGNASL